MKRLGGDFISFRKLRDLWRFPRPPTLFGETSSRRYSGNLRRGEFSEDFCFTRQPTFGFAYFVKQKTSSRSCENESEVLLSKGNLFLRDLGKSALLFLFMGIFLISFTFAQSSFGGSTSGTGFSGSTNYWQYNQPTFSGLYGSSANQLWPILGNASSDQCEATSDFLIAIPPGGCSPSVVRSDLLEEQNVPVFCQLYSLQVNPLIKVSSIKSISFSGKYPDGVSGISFHPARVASRSYDTLVGSPVVDNIGYVVINLKRNKIEANMEDWIAGNLTATIKYDADEAYGTGKAEYYLPMISDDEWETQYKENSFWRGLGYLRLRNVDGAGATIQVMASKDTPIRTVTLKEGETSGVMYSPGYYCKAGLQIRLNRIVSDEDSALLNIDGNDIWVRRGSRILNDQCSVTSLNVTKENSGYVRLSCPGQNIILELGNLVKDQKGIVGRDVTKTVAEEFGLGTKVVEELVKDYRVVKDPQNGGIVFAEESLSQQITLAKTSGDFGEQERLGRMFLENYPDSKFASKIRDELDLHSVYNYSNAYSSVYVTNSYHSIGLVKMRNVDESSKKVTLRGAVSGTYSEGAKVSYGGKGEYILIRSINANRVSLSHYVPEGRSADTLKSSIDIIAGAEGVLNGVGRIFVDNIDVKGTAYVSLIPQVSHTTSRSNFTFRVGIEKRSINLSTEKTIELLENLNKTIEKWNNINTKLEKLVTGMKTACFATSAILLIKNAASGINGESLARQKVMERYKTKCDTDPKYSSMTHTECYGKLSSEIEADVKSTTAGINKVNDIIDKKVKGASKTEGVFENSVIDQPALVDDLKKSIDPEWMVKVNGEEVKTADLTTTEQVRSVLLVQELKRAGAGPEAVASAENEMKSALNNVAYLNKQKKQTLDASNALGVDPSRVSSIETRNPRVQIWPGTFYKDIRVKLSGGDSKPTIDDNTAVHLFSYSGKNYLAVLIGGADKTISKSYYLEGGKWVGTTDPTVIRDFGNLVFKSGGTGVCSNRWPAGTAKIRYYETGNSKGLPAVVPFDLDQGWYAMVPNSGGTFLESSPSGYQTSGAVSYMKICNIGANGLMENCAGDDQVQTFNVNTPVDSYVSCPSLTSSQVKNLYTKAQEAVRQASSQYGQKSVSILGKVLEIGAPMSAVTGFECEDFMSPDDCKLMFNVCDPVICPTSRCDFGGKYPVSDVIQSGIVGSIALCLPNAKEGIFIPVCLSGIHAGLDSYVSILESEKQCLQKSLETGEHVGICDEITSVYKCEFFWSQAAPLMKIIVPRVVEAAYSGSITKTHGGGEYLTVQSAFDNLDKSIDYFKNSYAPNAFRAFNLRNVEEAGGEFCRAFIGTSLPTSADALKSLVAPESPPQFYASFSEELFSDVTLPSTSHYKVYYHIYSGKDSGVQYKIYLKNPPASSYYQSNPIQTVKSGYVAAGSSADEALDFTFPSGYKELCVVLNGKEECGFKQVTSDFGLDALSKAYVDGVAKQGDVTTEKACVSGSPSGLSLAQLNLQAGLSETVDPEIAMRGITRICASANPDPNPSSSRWKDVGYCGDQKLRCYLDTKSVNAAYREIGFNESLQRVESRTDLIESTRLGYDGVGSTLGKVLQETNALDKVNKGFLDATKTRPLIGELDKILNPGSGGLVGADYHRANALFLKARIYRSIVEAKVGAGTTRGEGAVSRLECSVPKDCEVKYVQNTEGGYGCVSGYCVSLAKGEIVSGTDISLLKKGDVIERAVDKKKYIFSGTVSGGFKVVLAENLGGVWGSVVGSKEEEISCRSGSYLENCGFNPYSSINDQSASGGGVVGGRTDNPKLIDLNVGDFLKNGDNYFVVKDKKNIGDDNIITLFSLSDPVNNQVIRGVIHSLLSEVTPLGYIRFSKYNEVNSISKSFGDIERDFDSNNIVLYEVGSGKKFEIVDVYGSLNIDIRDMSGNSKVILGGEGDSLISKGYIAIYSK